MAKKNNHWYARNVGDYARKTKSLSMLEHGAYTLLLDEYYATSQPLAANASVLHRICIAFAAEEQAAVQTVLQKFFRLDGDVWRHDRADEELLKRSKISKERSKAAHAKHSQRDAIAPDLHTVLHPTATATTTVDKEIAIAIPVVPSEFQEMLKRQFEQFWLAWVPVEMSKGDKKQAFKFYLKALKGVENETLIRTATQYLDNCRALDSKSKHVSTWLNGHGWLNDDALGPIPAGGGGGHGRGVGAGKPTALELALADRTHRGTAYTPRGAAD